MGLCMGPCCAYYFVMINVNCAGADEGSDQINQAPGVNKGNTLTVVASLLRMVRGIVFLATGLAIVGYVKVMSIEACTDHRLERTLTIVIIASATLGLGLGLIISFVTLFGEIDEVILVLKCQ